MVSFVDLAIGNVGEDLEKLNLLEDFGSVMGTYSAFFPLLKPTSDRLNLNLSLLINRVIQPFHQALMDQPTAPKKLTAVGRELDVLAMLNDEATSMEKSQMERLKAITRTGVFMVNAKASHEIIMVRSRILIRSDLQLASKVEVVLEHKLCPLLCFVDSAIAISERAF